MSQLDRKKLLKNCGCRAAAKMQNPGGHAQPIEIMSISYGPMRSRKLSLRRPPRRKLLANPHWGGGRRRRRRYYSYPIYQQQFAPGYTYYDQSAFCRWVWNGVFWQCYPWNAYQPYWFGPNATAADIASPQPVITVSGKRRRNQHAPQKQSYYSDSPKRNGAALTYATLAAPQGTTRGAWIPAVSNINTVPPGVTTYVLVDGQSSRGWKYTAGVVVPTPVTVTATQNGGPTGLLVQATPTMVGCVACSAAPIVAGRSRSWPRRRLHNLGARRFDECTQ